MVFRYFRTMFRWLIERGELVLGEAPTRCYTALVVRSKAKFIVDERPQISVREASVAPATPFKRRSRKVDRSGPPLSGNPTLRPRAEH